MLYLYTVHNYTHINIWKQVTGNKLQHNLNQTKIIYLAIREISNAIYVHVYHIILCTLN